MAEPRHYTAGEGARLAGLLARGAAQAGRGKSTAKVDAAIDRLQEQACKREAAEAKARETAETKRLQERAAKRASRRWF